MIAFEPTDILFGRGPTYYNHPGNKIFRKVIKSYTIFYRNDTPKMMKSACINDVWEVLVVLGCRFLLRNSDADSSWFVASDEVAKKKISHALRDSRYQFFYTSNEKAQGECPDIFVANIDDSCVGSIESASELTEWFLQNVD